MNRQRLIALLLASLSAVSLVVYSRYRSRLPPWWAANGGGIPYVVFWMALVFAIWPRRKSVNRIGLLVLLGTCLIEFAQLWNPEPLASFRATRIGAGLLGTSFHWDDFPPYFLGAAVGWGLLRLICAGQPDMRQLADRSLRADQHRQP